MVGCSVLLAPRAFTSLVAYSLKWGVLGWGPERQDKEDSGKATGALHTLGPKRTIPWWWLKKARPRVGPGTLGCFDGPRQYEGSSHLIALWTKFPHHQRGLFLIARIYLGHRALWGYWSLLSGGKCGVGERETFRRRDAQLSSVAPLSQLQILLMGHVLLLPSMALVPQGKAGRPHENRTQNLGGTSSITEPREVALPSLSECELYCHLWMPEHQQHSRPSTSSTFLTSPSPNSLPVSLQPLLPFCAPLSPHALLSPPLPSSLTALATHIPLPAPPCSHISGLPTLPPHPLLFHA